MRFQDYVSRTIIPEWKNYYINYSVPSELLGTLKALHRRVNFKVGNFQVNSLTEEERNIVAAITDHFKTVLRDQIAKFEDFLVYKIEMSLKPILLKIIYNIKNLKGKDFSVKELEEIRQRLKEEIKNYYKEINKVKQFLGLNLKIFYKLSRKYKQAFTAINMFDKDVLVGLNEVMRRVNVQKLNKVLERYSKVVETIFVEQFFREREYKDAYEELNKVVSNNQFTKKESFMFGAYLGSFFVSAIICALLLVETRFFAEQQSEFVIYQFPIFRGALVLFLYVFLLGVDVYVWEEYNINFKNVFGLGYYCSSAFIIMKRAFGFLSIWILIFSYCALSNSAYFDQAIFFDKQVSIYLAPVVWGAFFGYLFFPSKQYFNYEGRVYLLKLLKKLAVVPFTKTISTATKLAIDQLLSFTIIIKDFMYTMCYFDNVIEVGTVKNECTGESFKRVEMCVVLFILLWKLIPNISNFVPTYKNRHNMTPEKFKEAFRNFMIKTSRSIVGFTLTIISYHMKKYPSLFYYWIHAIIYVTLVNCYCDLKFDWGFLAEKNLLRKKLAYPNRAYYYGAMIANIFLRLSWTISLAPFVMRSPLTRSCVTLLTSLLECVRRMIWNFIKVEYEHLKLEGSFNAAQNYDLPFVIEIDMSKAEVAQAVNIQVSYYLKKAFLNNSHEINLTESDMIEKMMSEGIDPSQTARITNMTIRRESDFKFISEVDEKNDLLEYDTSLHQCKKFIEFLKNAKLGTGVSPINPDLLIVNSNFGKTGLHDTMNQDSLLRTIVNQQALAKSPVVDSEIIAVGSENLFKQPLFESGDPK